MFNSEVPFPKSKGGRFTLALCISVLLPFLYFYSITFIESFNGVSTSACGLGGGTCSSFESAGDFFGGWIFLTTITFGAPVYIPAFILWAIFELVVWVGKRKQEIKQPAKPLDRTGLPS